MNQTIDDWFILNINVPNDDFIFRHKKKELNYTRDVMISNNFTNEQLQQIINKENSKERWTLQNIHDWVITNITETYDKHMFKNKNGNTFNIHQMIDKFENVYVFLHLIYNYQIGFIQGKHNPLLWTITYDENKNIFFSNEYIYFIRYDKDYMVLKSRQGIIDRKLIDGILNVHYKKILFNVVYNYVYTYSRLVGGIDTSNIESAYSKFTTLLSFRQPELDTERITNIFNEEYKRILDNLLGYVVWFAKDIAGNLAR